MGYKKKLHFNEINGFPDYGTEDLFPITVTSAVYSEDGRNLDDILAQLGTGGGSGDGSSSDPNITYFWAFKAADSLSVAKASLNQNEQLVPPSGWSLSSNVTVRENQTVFMTIARKNGTTWLKWPSGGDAGKIWSTPIGFGGGTTSTTGADGNGYNYAYARLSKSNTSELPDFNSLHVTVEAIEDARSLNKGVLANGTYSTGQENVWYDHPVGISLTYPREFVVVYAGNEDDGWTYIAGPILWSRWGQDGKDGDGIEYIYYRRPKDEPAPLNWGTTIQGRVSGVGEIFTVQVASLSEDEHYQEDDFIPEGWTDDPQSIGSDYPEQYVSVRKRTWNNDTDTSNGWGMFSTPALWNTVSVALGTGDVSTSVAYYNKATLSEGNSTTWIDRTSSSVPSGWSVTPNIQLAADEYVWMISGTLLNGSMQADADGNYWSSPMRITGIAGNSSTGATGADGADINFVYYRSSSMIGSDKTPNFTVAQIEAQSDINSDYGLAPNGTAVNNTTDEAWRDHPIGVKDTAMYEYVSMNFKPADVRNADGSVTLLAWKGWTPPALWSKYGERGLDGDGVEYIFTLSDSSTPPSLSADGVNYVGYVGTDLTERTVSIEGCTSDEYYKEDDFVLKGWSDDPQLMEPDNPYLYVSMRRSKDGVWQPFSPPTLWSYYSKDGVVSGYILASDNDTVIIDNDTTSTNAFNTAAEAQLELQDSANSGKSVIYILGDYNADGWTPSVNKTTGKVSYTVADRSTPFTVGTYYTYFKAYIEETGATGDTTTYNGKTYKCVAVRKQIILVKNFNTGEAYRLIVTPNCIPVTAEMKATSSGSLTIKYLTVKGNTAPVNSVCNTYSKDGGTLSDGTIYYNIEPNGIAASKLNSNLSYSLGTDLQPYYVVNLYYKTSAGSILIDSETVDCIPAGLDGKSAYVMTLTNDGAVIEDNGAHNAIMTATLNTVETTYDGEVFPTIYKLYKAYLPDTLSVFVNGTKKSEGALLAGSNSAPANSVTYSIGKASISASSTAADKNSTTDILGLDGETWYVMIGAYEKEADTVPITSKKFNITIKDLTQDGSMYRLNISDDSWMFDGDTGDALERITSYVTVSKLTGDVIESLQFQVVDVVPQTNDALFRVYVPTSKLDLSGTSTGGRYTSLGITLKSSKKYSDVSLGFDIKLYIGTYMYESEHVDCILNGKTGLQGAPGTSYTLSLSNDSQIIDDDSSHTNIVSGTLNTLTLYYNGAVSAELMYFKVKNTSTNFSTLGLSVYEKTGTNVWSSAVKGTSVEYCIGKTNKQSTDKLTKDSTCSVTVGVYSDATCQNELACKTFSINIADISIDGSFYMLNLEDDTWVFDGDSGSLITGSGKSKVYVFKVKDGEYEALGYSWTRTNPFSDASIRDDDKALRVYIDDAGIEMRTQASAEATSFVAGSEGNIVMEDAGNQYDDYSSGFNIRLYIGKKLADSEHIDCVKNGKTGAQGASTNIITLTNDTAVIDNDSPHSTIKTATTNVATYYVGATATKCTFKIVSATLPTGMSIYNSNDSVVNIGDALNSSAVPSVGFYLGRTTQKDDNNEELTTELNVGAGAVTIGAYVNNMLKASKTFNFSLAALDGIGSTYQLIIENDVLVYSGDSPYSRISTRKPRINVVLILNGVPQAKAFSPSVTTPASGTNPNTLTVVYPSSFGDLLAGTDYVDLVMPTTYVQANYEIKLYLGNILVDSETIDCLKNGEKGELSDEPGPQGINGAILRYRGVWADIIQMYDDDEEAETKAIISDYDRTNEEIYSGEITLYNQTTFYGNTQDTDGLYYIDVVKRRGKYYKCNTTHLTLPTDDAGAIYSFGRRVEFLKHIPGNSNSYWTESLEFDFIVTDSLIANAINSTTISAKDVVILDDSNEIVAGMSSAHEGVSLDNVRIWAGKAKNGKLFDATKAPFRVTEQGDAYIEKAHIKGTVTASLFDMVDSRGSVIMEMTLLSEADQAKVNDSGLTLDPAYSDIFTDDAYVGLPVIKVYFDGDEYIMPLIPLGASSSYSWSPLNFTITSVTGYSTNNVPPLSSMYDRYSDSIFYAIQELPICISPDGITLSYPTITVGASKTNVSSVSFQIATNRTAYLGKYYSLDLNNSNWAMDDMPRRASYSSDLKAAALNMSSTIKWIGSKVAGTYYLYLSAGVIDINTGGMVHRNVHCVIYKKALFSLGALTYQTQYVGIVYIDDAYYCVSSNNGGIWSVSTSLTEVNDYPV